MGVYMGVCIPMLSVQIYIDHNKKVLLLIFGNYFVHMCKIFFILKLVSSQFFFLFNMLICQTDTLLRTLN